MTPEEAMELITSNKQLFDPSTGMDKTSPVFKAMEGLINSNKPSILERGFKKFSKENIIFGDTLKVFNKNNNIFETGLSGMPELGSTLQRMSNPVTVYQRHEYKEQADIPPKQAKELKRQIANKLRRSQLHEFIWHVICGLRKDNRRDGVYFVRSEIQKNYKKYDHRGIISEVTDDLIYWCSTYQKQKCRDDIAYKLSNLGVTIAGIKKRGKRAQQIPMSTRLTA